MNKAKGRPRSDNKHKGIMAYLPPDLDEQLRDFSTKTRLCSLSSCIRFLMAHSLKILEERIERGELSKIIEEIPNEYRTK